MTGPMPQGLDPEILANIEKLKKARMESDIPTYLREVAQVDPAQYGYGAPPGRSLGQDFMHGAGLLGRMGIEGLGAAASAPFALLDMGLKGRGGPTAPSILPQGMTQNQGPGIADQLGLPQPEGAGERILSAGGQNAVMSALMPGVGPGMAAVGMASGMAGQGAGEMGASPMGQMAASAAVGLGLPVVGALGAEVIRSAFAGAEARRAAARQSQALLQAGNPDMPMSLGQVTSGGLLGGARVMQGGMRNIPGASTTLANNAEDQAEAMGTKVAGVADRLAPGGATVETAGMAVRSGISGDWLSRFKTTRDGLYNRVWQLVNPTTDVVPAKTVGLFGQMSQLQAAARPLDDSLFLSPQMKKWSEGLTAQLQANPAGVQINVLKEWRSKLGEMLDGSNLIADVGLRDVKRLYGTLTEDITAGIAQTNPQALPAWNRAVTFARVGHDRLESILQPLIDKNTADVAFRAMMSGTKDGAVVLRQTMKSINPTQQGIVASAVLRRLGQAPAGMQGAEGDLFSPETYLTNWNKLAPEAKSALFFQSDKTGTTMRELDAIAKAAEIRKVAGRTLFNPAGTSANVAFFSIMSGLGAVGTGAATGNLTGAGLGAALGPAVAAGGANILAKAMTNPKTISWLLKQTRVPAGALKQQALILAKDSEKWDPESRDIGQELSQAITSIDWPKMLMATALADQAR